ncbi:MAG TPA: EAL domain-containing protein [Chthoniobacterales bacterium]
MRNQTAIRLLYVLAVLAGILPPLLFLGYAYRQSVADVEHQLDFVGTGTLVRTETVLDTVAGTLRKVPSLIHRQIDQSSVDKLRQAVFLDRYIQSIGIRTAGELLCNNQTLYPRPVRIPDPKESLTLPAPGEVAVRPLVDRGFPSKSLVVLYTFTNGMAVEGIVDPALFSEFFDYYARQFDCREFIRFRGESPLTDFGEDHISLPAKINLTIDDRLQWLDGRLVMVKHSTKYPIHTITVASNATVLAKWTRSAVIFGLTGLAVSALLSGLIIRLARRTRTLEADLREAVRYREIDVHYQPIIDLETGRCVGAEALMRWPHRRRGLIPAGEFIAIAERTDLIVPMTDTLLEKIAVSLGPTLREDPSLHIGVNLAHQHFVTTRILDRVAEITKADIPPGQIIFEITERGLVSDKDSVARTVMAGLGATGARLAVDDFGTGYSSLSYLQRFPLDYLKVDKAFVDGISSATESSGLVDQIIRIGHSLGMEIIAEGVEEGFQADYLKAQGVKLAQGWHFGRPMPIDDFLKFVRERNHASPGRTTRIPTTPEAVASARPVA